MNTTSKGTTLCRAGCWVASIGLLLIAMSAGHKLGLLSSWQVAFAALGLGGLLMLVALGLTAVGLLRSGGTGGDASRGATWLAFLAALLMTGINANNLRAFGAPPIHDITTDTVNPPQFVAVVPLREADNARNPPGYSGADTASLQAAAYPDITTIRLDEPFAAAFARADRTARAMGWAMAASVPAEGRIEATATTGWIGFRDDVVIRVRPDGNGSLVDVRSKSRVGRGDAGMNARRIREYRQRLLGV